MARTASRSRAWPDKSGLGRDLTALDPSQAATMRRNVINGRAALEFNGTSSLLKTYNSTFTIGQPNTFFIVYRSLDPNSTAVPSSSTLATRR